MALFRPAKPKGRARLSVDTALAAGQQVIPLDTLDWSEGDVGWNGTSGFVVGKPGLYGVVTAISRAAVGTAASLQVRAFLNGGAIPNTTTILTPATTAIVTASQMQFVPVEEGDLLEMAGTGHGSSGWTVRSVSTALTVVRLGPERWT